MEKMLLKLFLKPADIIIRGFYYLFTVFTHIPVIFVIWWLVIVVYCILEMVGVPDLYGTEAFRQFLQNRNLPDFEQIITCQGAVASSFFYLIIMVQTVIIYPVACYLDEEIFYIEGERWFCATAFSNNGREKKRFAKWFIFWLLFWVYKGWSYDWSLFGEVLWLMLVWSTVSWVINRLFNPLNIKSYRFKTERSLVQYWLS